MSVPGSLAEQSRQLVVRDTISTLQDHIYPFLLIALVGVVIGAYTTGAVRDTYIIVYLTITYTVKSNREKSTLLQFLGPKTTIYQ